MRALLALLLTAALAAGQAPKPPTEVKAAGGLVVLTAPPGDAVSWDWDERLLPAKPGHQTTHLADGGRTLVLAGPPGTHRVTCTVFAKDGTVVRQVYLVTFAGAPPGPTPVPETLDARLRKAHDADRAIGKDKADLKFLAAVYAQAGDFLKVSPTVSQAYQIVDFAVAQAVPAGELPGTLTVLDARLWEAAPRVPDAPLTDAVREALRAAFTDCSRAVTALLAPQPPPGPGPTPVPIAGVRVLLLVRETADGTPALARTLTALRAGAHADYLRTKNHALTVLDDDAVGADGKPAPLLVKWRPHYQGLKLPALVIADQAGTVLHAGSLADNATAEQIIETLKKVGG